MAVWGVIALLALARAAVPRIDLIEIYQTNQVMIHFETEPNRTYVVQRSTAFGQASNGTAAVWTDIASVPAVPYNQHWIAVDTNPTLPVRFYRLKVTP